MGSIPTGAGKKCMQSLHYEETFAIFMSRQKRDYMLPSGLRNYSTLLSLKKQFPLVKLKKSIVIKALKGEQCNEERNYKHTPARSPLFWLRVSTVVLNTDWFVFPYLAEKKPPRGARLRPDTD